MHLRLRVFLEGQNFITRYIFIELNQLSDWLRDRTHLQHYRDRIGIGKLETDISDMFTSSEIWIYRPTWIIPYNVPHAWMCSQFYFIFYVWQQYCILLYLHESSFNRIIILILPQFLINKTFTDWIYRIGIRNLLMLKLNIGYRIGRQNYELVQPYFYIPVNTFKSCRVEMSNCTFLYKENIGSVITQIP